MDHKKYAASQAKKRHPKAGKALRDEIMKDYKAPEPVCLIKKEKVKEEEAPKEDG